MFINYSSQMLVYPADWKDPALTSSPSSSTVTFLPSSVTEPAMIDINPYYFERKDLPHPIGLWQFRVEFAS